MQEPSSTLLLGRVHHAATELCGTLLHARMHEANPGHLLLANQHGQLYEVQLAEQDSQPGAFVAKFEMYLASGDNTLNSPPPVHRPWACFECHEDGIILAHQGSCNLLFVALPSAVGECSGAFLFGSHTAEVRVTTRSHSCLVSGSADGEVKLWDLALGQLLHSYQHQAGSSVTALEMVGPLMVAMGDSLGLVTLFDLTAQRLTPTSRFHVDQGPVTCLAAGLTCKQQVDILGDVRAPRAPDGGGVVAPPIGLPWRAYPYNLDANPEDPRDTLLAVASEAGWLHVYAPRMGGEFAWRRQYSGTLPGKPYMQFSRQSDYLLLVTGGQAISQVMLLSTTSWVAHKQWELPHSVMAAGLVPPAGELAVFSDTLQPATRLVLYACPQDRAPVTLQAKLPAGPKVTAASQPTSARTASGRQGLPASDQNLVEGMLAGQHFLDEIQQLVTDNASPTAAYRRPSTPLQPVLYPPAPTRDLSPHPDMISDHPQRARLAADISQTAGTAAAASAAAAGWQATRAGLLPASMQDTSSEAVGGSRGDMAARMAALRGACLRPSTLPSGRSWLGGPAPEIDLSDVLAPPAPRTTTPPAPAQPLYHEHHTSHAGQDKGTASQGSEDRAAHLSQHAQQEQLDRDKQAAPLSGQLQPTGHEGDNDQHRQYAGESTLQRWLPSGMTLSGAPQADGPPMQGSDQAIADMHAPAPFQAEEHQQQGMAPTGEVQSLPSKGQQSVQATVTEPTRGDLQRQHICEEDGVDDELCPRALPPQLSVLTPSARRPPANIPLSLSPSMYLKHEQQSAELRQSQLTGAQQQPQPPSYDADGQGDMKGQQADEWAPRVVDWQDKQYMGLEDEEVQAVRSIPPPTAWQQKPQQQPRQGAPQELQQQQQGWSQVDTTGIREDKTAAVTQLNAGQQSDLTDELSTDQHAKLSLGGTGVVDIAGADIVHSGSKRHHNVQGDEGQYSGDDVGSAHAEQQQPDSELERTAVGPASAEEYEMPDFVSHVPVAHTSAHSMQQDDSRNHTHTEAAVAELNQHHPGTGAGAAEPLSTAARQQRDGGAIAGAYGLRKGAGRVNRPRPAMPADTGCNERMHLQSDSDAIKPAAPMPRSPYRGYKPNMAVLLKELRARNAAARQHGPTRPSSGVSVQQGSGPPSDENQVGQGGNAGLGAVTAAGRARGHSKKGITGDVPVSGDQVQNAVAWAANPAVTPDASDSDVPQHQDQQHQWQGRGRQLGQLQVGKQQQQQLQQQQQQQPAGVPERAPQQQPQQQLQQQQQPLGVLRPASMPQRSVTPPPAPSIASPMLMGSPTSTVCRQEAGLQLQAGTAAAPGLYVTQHTLHNLALESPLAQPHLNSSLQLMARIDALQQGQDGQPPVSITPAEHAELVRRAADLTVNIPPHVQMYNNLQQIGATVFAPKPAKQLHPNWVASRNIRPEIGQLWNAQEQQREVMSTRGVALYTRPTPAAVALAALDLA